MGGLGAGLKVLCEDKMSSGSGSCSFGGGERGADGGKADIRFLSIVLYTLVFSILGPTTSMVRGFFFAEAWGLEGYEI